MIKINSQQCGAGKTTQWIYPNIRKLLLRSQQVLLVVPSIDLQEQYAQSFARYITVINNLTCKQVTQEIYNAFETGRRFICITHQAFELLDLPVNVKDRYNLIIDEVINPYRLQKINFNTDSKYVPYFKFNEIFKFEDKEYFKFTDIDYTKDKRWYVLSKFEVANNIPFLNESKKWIDLFNTNFLSYMRYEDHVDLCKQNRKQIVIVQELNPAIIKNWESVSIAAAAFECTFMRYWLDNNNLEFDVIENFERHSTKVVLHIPSIDNFKWSKYKKNKHVDILNQYHNYVDSKVNSAPLVIRNNDELRTLADEIRVSHNVHGINLENRKEITNVSLETALVPDPLLKNFYKKTIGLSDNKITKAFSSYLFYQVVMRTAIRDDIEINVFALDVDTICRFIDFFDNVEAIEEIDVSYVTKPAGRPKTTDEQKKATKREYMKKYMANKRKNRHSVKC